MIETELNFKEAKNRMVATTDCTEESRPIAGKKVSKPVMEKKRRARINKCLDQLKSLLESYYSTSIRKRKLEKADILELTVNHLRNLQKIQTCTSFASEVSNFHSGYRRCLTNVNQFLLVDDNLNGSERSMLSQLSRKMWRARGEEEAFSTTDSYPERAEAAEGAQRLVPSVAGWEDGDADKSKALMSNTQNSPCVKSEKPCKRTERLHPKNSSHKNFDSVTHGNEAANTVAQNVWRPW